MKPGKYEIKVSPEGHKASIMAVYIPPQDPDLSLIDYSTGLEGVNRFTFELEEGEGNITLDEFKLINDNNIDYEYFPIERRFLGDGKSKVTNKHTKKNRIGITYGKINN